MVELPNKDTTLVQPATTTNGTGENRHRGGCRTPGGETLRGNEDIRRYLLEEAGFAAVPFQAFGVEGDTGWFRLSAGAVSLDDIAAVLPKVAAAIDAVGVVTGNR